MKIAFTGDICFGNIDKFTNNPFKNVVATLSKLNCVVNLEAVFLPKSYTGNPIKQKMCLRQNDETIAYLKQLNPFLVNLSNNHINDYGNFGAENVIKQLQTADLEYLGAGYSDQDHNLFGLKKEKILFLAYTTRSTDTTGSKLFNEANLIGPKEFSFELIKRQIKGYERYKKIILFHWGVEDENYPLPEQRTVAKKLIDLGIDLIIGNHPHVVQSYEQYKGKWIFYCLGHLFFPHFVMNENKLTYYRGKYFDFQHKNRNKSIVPVFKIDQEGIVLDQIYTIKANRNFEQKFINKSIHHNLFLFSNDKLYSLFYKYHAIYRRWVCRFCWPIRKVKILIFFTKWNLVPFSKQLFGSLKGYLGKSKSVPNGK